VHAISTHSADDMVQAMGNSRTSKGKVSRLCRDHERVQAFRSVISVAVIIATDVIREGRYDMLI
jgi:hypothetical protein